MSNQTEEQESKMNVYDAIMKAANHIEANPAQFDYERPNVGCGSKACAIGWIAHFANESKEDADGVLNQRTQKLLGVMYWPDAAPDTFESRMNWINGEWKWDARSCALTLRAYAYKYHLKEKPPLRTDSELVADLLRKISTERIPEDMPA